jgi:hypothetical protein
VSDQNAPLKRPNRTGSSNGHQVFTVLLGATVMITSGIFNAIRWVIGRAISDFLFGSCLVLVVIVGLVLAGVVLHAII